jgi:endoglucanase
MKRREFIQLTGAALTAGMAGLSRAAEPAGSPAAAQPTGRRWRGFNLLEMFSPERRSLHFRAEDFEIMTEWGFNFARIPMSYWLWSKPDPARWLSIDEEPIRRVDDVIALGRRHGVHINLNLHRIPGYCINGRELEPLDLFTGPEASRARALEAACHHWSFFARRYQGIPSAQLSFDLINEPAHIGPADYAPVVKALVGAIREADPDRLIIADGIDAGRTPVPELAALNLLQSTRGYEPMQVSHYQAGWVPRELAFTPSPPTWPLRLSAQEVWDRDRLVEKLIKPWKALEATGVKVHVGEWGAYRFTPHAVVLAWMRDLLSLWQEAGWGWALWNLRGDFGVLDSDRSDVRYEAYKGHKLDRAMLDLIRAF